MDFQMLMSRWRLPVVVLSALVLAAPALAQKTGNASPPVDVLSATSLPADAAPVYDNEPTHPSISLTPDRSELVRLDREAGTIIVGNPAHLSVLMENNQSLVLVGKAPGATYFTVLDDGGAVIMQRHVIVAAPKEQYVRVRRSCAGSRNGTCQETSVFYCPDMCHNVSISTEQAPAPTNPAGAAASVDALPPEEPAGGNAGTSEAPSNE